MNKFRSVISVVVLALLLPSLTAETINPFPRELLREKEIAGWDFTEGLQGWRAHHDCTVQAAEGMMQITSTGGDPWLYSPAIDIPSPIAVRLRICAEGGSDGRLFFISKQGPDWTEKQANNFPLTHDGKWRIAETELPAGHNLVRLRLDPGSAPGRIDIDWIKLIHKEYHPLEITSVKRAANTVTAFIKNHSKQTRTLTANSQNYTVPSKGGVEIKGRLTEHSLVEPYTVSVQSESLPDLSRTVFTYHPEVQAESYSLKSNRVSARICRKSASAEILYDGQVVAILAPIVHTNGVTPKFDDTQTRQDRLTLKNDTLAVALSLTGDELTVAIESSAAVEGPVLRSIGALEQGLFAGIEYLGKAESSSSKLDIETEEHIRYAPKPWKVTMPLMATRTPRAVVAMTWENMSLQPVFATPNFFDGVDDHRMSLRGTDIHACIRISKTTLEDAILWATKRRGLPELPKAPRSWEEQKKLCIKAFNESVGNEQGWGHCAEEEKWPRRPHVDLASTVYRLTGSVPPFERYVPGGGHIPNEAVYFLSGQAQQWLDRHKRQVQNMIRMQQQDGSYRYDGKYRRGHHENTASGVCARPAYILLNFAYLTGDREALKAGLKTLAYMKGFRTPRGAQVWECALHTPDILASAYMVLAYVRGYELTQRQDLLDEARRWALTGVPFVYQWGPEETGMKYATIGVLGATNWIAPNWIGRPVQWCGTVYAYGLLKLAPYDKTLNWRKLAEGILISSEHQQYTEGKFTGTLPDSIDPLSGKQYPWNINPSALVSLRLLIRGELDSLAFVHHQNHRIVSPFPITIENGQVWVTAPRGQSYQIVIDGETIRSIVSQGKDLIPLD